MNKNKLWQKILEDLADNPRDFKTVPRNNRTPLYFYAKANNDFILIDNALTDRPSCKLSAPRKILFSDFQTVFSYYDSWKAGIVGVRDEVRKVSMNTAYIFALIKHYNNSI